VSTSSSSPNQDTSSSRPTTVDPDRPFTSYQGAGAVIVNLPDPLALTARQAAQLGAAIVEVDGFGQALGQLGCLAVMEEGD
jgi:hypothetical protein